VRDHDPLRIFINGTRASGWSSDRVVPSGEQVNVGDEAEVHCRRYCVEDRARVTSGARPARAEAEDEENSS
jgi:hypothetical protein